jgi:transposase-like protein
VEGFHRQVRKVTKTKGAFTSDDALLKLVYLVVNRISEKWIMPGPAHPEHRRSAWMELDFVSTLYYV